MIKIDIEPSIFTGAIRIIWDNDTMIGRVDDGGIYLDKPFHVSGVDMV